ncbi:hypothetical protein, partial [Pseudomonas rhodesiae]|uniref:hypothetical protein n=1 Tax=Pseudomonas rhodesiae TaxID=76760 RepID=UPI0028AA1961
SEGGADSTGFTNDFYPSDHILKEPGNWCRHVCFFHFTTSKKNLEVNATPVMGPLQSAYASLP